jgi:hypothetical protein
VATTTRTRSPRKFRTFAEAFDATVVDLIRREELKAWKAAAPIRTRQVVAFGELRTQRLHSRR